MIDEPTHPADVCADCQHVKRIHLGNVGRCLVTNCPCSAFDPPAKHLIEAMERGEWP